MTGVWEKINKISQSKKHPASLLSHCTSRIARKWLETNSVEMLEWSVQSTDLNPIEYLWQHSKKKLTGRETVSRSIREL